MHASRVDDRGATKGRWKTIKPPARKHYGARPVTTRVTRDRLDAASPIEVDRGNPGFLSISSFVSTGATRMSYGHAGVTVRPRLMG